MQNSWIDIFIEFLIPIYMYKDYRNIKYRKYFQLRQMDGLICFNIKKKISTLIKKLLNKRLNLYTYFIRVSNVCFFPLHWCKGKYNQCGCDRILLI